MSNQALIRKLESDDVASRREAAETLAQYPSMGAIMERDERDISDAIAPLARVLFDEDAEVREYAARAIRAAQGDSQDISAALPALLRCLADERTDLRRSATLILRDAVIKGADASPYESQLAALLDDPIDEVKWGAADALAYHFAARKRWDRVAGLLTHTDPDVAQETAGTLAEFYFRFDYRPVLPELLSLLSAESLEPSRALRLPDLRLVAAKAVVCRPRDAADLAAAMPVLLESLAHEETRIRVSALQTLDQAIGGFFRHCPQIGPGLDWECLAPVTGALPALEQALSDPDQEGALQAAVIRALTTYLGGLPVAETVRFEGWIELFQKRLRSRDEGVKKEAAKVLTVQWVRGERWEELEDLLTQGPKVVKRQALNTLANDETIRALGFAPLLPVILGMLADSDGDLAYAAGRALERVDAVHLLEPLESGPIDNEACWGLLKEVRGKVHRKLFEILKAELEGRGGADEIAFLIGHLGHEQRAVRAWAAESIWWIAQSRDISAAISPLIQLLDDPDPATRSSAATALGDGTRYGSIELAHQALMQLTRDKAARVRKSAFRALWMSAEAGGVLTPLIAALCEALRADPDQENRGEIAVVLGAAVRAGCDLGAFVPDLVAALADDFQRVRFYTARTLHYVAKGGVGIRPAVPALARALLDKDQPVADWAVAALQTYAANAPEAREVLEAVRALGSESKQVSRVIVACEKQLGVE